MRKLVRKGLHNDVIEEIGKRIVSGEFKPGSPLPSEVALVTILGISRTALREALRVLGAKGLVEAKPKIGTIVQPSSEWNHMDADIFSWRLNSGDVEQVTIELQQMRQIFEPLAASLAAENATADDLAQLTAAYNDMETAADAGAAFVDPDVRFHRGIIAASGKLAVRLPGTRGGCSAGDLLPLGRRKSARSKCFAHAAQSCPRCDRCTQPQGRKTCHAQGHRRRRAGREPDPKMEASGCTWRQGLCGSPQATARLT